MLLKLLSIIPVFLVLLTRSALGQADFVDNKGQWPSQILWRADLPHGALWVENQALTWQFYDPTILSKLHPGSSVPDPDPLYREHSYRVHFEGASIPDPSAKKTRPYYHNYYLGNDSSTWVSGAAVHGLVEMEDVYPGIALKLYSQADHLKYDFVIAPGADPSAISLRFEGADHIALENGELVITTTVTQIREKKPFAYQLVNGRLTEVSCGYALTGNTVSFVLGKYNTLHPLVIDPEIAFSTYIGSTASNFGFTACDDSQENLISGAAVFAQNYPVTPGAFQSNFDSGAGNYMDVALSKFNPEGNTLLYSTYLGGSKQETPHSIVTDSQDNIIVMGVTGSSNFPTTAGAYQPGFQGGAPLMMSNFFTSGHPDGCDFFIHKFSATGALLAGTLAGYATNDGLNYADQLYYNYGDAFRGEVNVDENDHIFVASVVRGAFPVTGQGPQNTYGGGDCDGIVMKFTPELSVLEWSTYIGGSGSDACYSIQFEEAGFILVAGGTRSANFPHAVNGEDTSQNGQCDGFLLKINPTTFNVVAGTFVGTSQYDQVYFIQTDLEQNIYVFGQTRGNMAITSGAYGQQNSGQFVRKYNNSLTAMQWNTTVGTGSGAIDISPTAFLVSDCGQIYFSGWGGGTNSNTCQVVYDCYATNSTTNGLPITSNAFQNTTDGSDFYLCVLSPDATELVYGSFLGGSESNEHVDGGTSRFNKNGSVYQAVCAGCQGNSDFPTTPGAWSDANPSFGCNLAVFRFNLGKSLAEIDIDGPDQICEGSPAQFQNLSTGATVWQWSFGDGGQSTTFEPTHIFEEPGEYTVTLIASDDLDCVLPDTTQITLTILPGVNPSVQPVDSVCLGEQVQLDGTGSPNLFWVEDPTLSATDIADPIATPLAPATYYLVDFNDCETDTVSVFVDMYTPATSITPSQTICTGQTVSLSASGGVTYSWTPSAGLSTNTGPATEATPQETTTYSVLITTEEGCEVLRETTITVVLDEPGGQVYPTINMCQGNNAQLVAEDGFTWSWSPSSSLSNAFVQNPMAFPDVTTTYQVTITNACGTGVSQVTVEVVVPNVEVFGGGTICKGQCIEAWASGGTDYFWTPPGFAYPPFGQSTMLSPPETMAFTVAGFDDNGCGDQDTVWVYVLPLPEVNAGPDQYFEFPGSVYLFGNTFGLGHQWSPADHLSCTDCPYPVADPPTATWYYLSAVDHNGCVGIDSVFVKPYYPIWVPNTITPNNDGINDVFYATGVTIEGYHLQIFDRWGNLVFESRNPGEVWNGGIEDHYVQNDTYIWTIEYDSIDRRERLVGHVNVIR
ncbi:MAG: gliding motility-associated C-terminal domain-containing protein [Flavobacteriales bacterium]